MYGSMQVDAGKVILKFDHVNGSLRTLEGQPPRGFSIAGEDRRFVWAEAILNRNGTITVSSDKVPNPVAVRMRGPTTRFAMSTTTSGCL